MPFSEKNVTSREPMPQGYAFLPKGIAYKTLNCRKLTRASGNPLYVVIDNKSTLGLRAPRNIINQVHLKAKDTLATRIAAVQRKDAVDVAKATVELKAQFPKMPSKDRDLIINHGFRKHSGRVGRTGSIPLPKKVTLAVIAHIRHRHTNYEALLSRGEARDATRRTIWKQIESIMHEWGYTNGRY
jgi:hypothetical protein